jgi:hypothetical protein
MKSSLIEKEILEQINRLPFDQQCQVLEFARSLASLKPTGITGRELLRFSGSIEKSDLEIMTQAIEEGCEQVNLNEW